MRTLTTRSTFRPPPFVSASKGTGFAFPTNLVWTSSHHASSPTHHTASPTHLASNPIHHESNSIHDSPNPTRLSRPTFFTPSPLTAFIDNDSVLLGVSRPDSSGEVLHKGLLWNLTQPTNVSEKPYFPAGYPSGYSWPHIICASVVVTVVILIIVVGNLLVIWAIVRDKNLKGTQNYFIGSLALADFMLGLLIVPFSLANELMGYWHFGTVFCEVWKATDVLLCTASISSLCLISLDRYWSITKAIHYSRQRTPKRAAVMIFIVWFVSAAVCIPPLIGWNQPAPDSDWPVCALSEDIGYVLYSSMGSFYIPAFIMVFVYFKIYQAAKARARKNVIKTPRAAQSEKSEQKNSTESSGTDPQLLSQLQRQQQQQQLQQTTTPNTKDLVAETKGVGIKKLSMQSSVANGTEETTIISGCRCSNNMLDSPQSATPSSVHKELDFRTRSQSLPCRTAGGDELTKLISTDTDSYSEALYGPILNHMDRRRSFFHSMPAATTTTDTDSSMDLSYMQSCQHQQQQQRPPSYRSTMLQDTTRSPSPGTVHTPIADTAATRDNGAVQQFQILEPTLNGNTTNISSTLADKDNSLFGSLRRQWFQNNGKVAESHKSDNGKMGEKLKSPPKKKVPKKIGRGEDFSSAERQKRKLAKARERRATLVLGLVMAAFILCWLPFFLLYVASAFCDRCIPMMVFTVFFWIGYCNSALNPIIYTVFNRDFRKAFHRILFGRRWGR